MIMRENVILYKEAGALQESAFRELVTKASELDMTEVHKEIADNSNTT